MLKKILFALILVVGATVTHAESDMKTAASKAYVDTSVETLQDKIPAANQQGVGLGETVMTYTAAGNGAIGERGLYSDISSYDASTDGDKLITASALNDTFTNLPTTGTTKLECANLNDGCTLWTIVDQTAYDIRLPLGYTQLEYIESPRGAYIDTGVAYGKFVHDIAFIIDGERNLLGNGQSAGQFWEATDANRVVLSGRPINVDTRNRNIIEFTMRTNDASLQVGDDVLTFEHLSMNDRTYWLFGINGTNYGARAKLYGLKVYDLNDVLVRNFIPAKNSSNVVGMYDTVTGTFFTNAATSGPDFTPGPPVAN